ncbi:hypothetical protein [Cryptosporangium aurantiacum]|uniref:Uncharacterized protein n=1 Tax=Cryptosporangium aurantiacum TaxID=134849 RepID=A0A1M7RNR2_9ACTN|nr:hypothetical protein [Cryptosporangium aurantiacum]SHN47859.1 hypothetical protein SAMN05443668_12919 [Cryptosporangium aurantiacum]
MSGHAAPFHRLGFAVAIVLLALLGTAVPAAAGPRAETIRSNAVVVVGIAGLQWSDVATGRTPTLARLASSGSVGTLSVRAAPAVTCVGEGWLTLGAGRSAAIVEPSDIDTAEGCGPRTAPPVSSRNTGSGASIDGWEDLAELNRQLRFGAKPGLLGTRLTCAGAVGTGGALAAADSSGNVDVYRATLPDDPAPLLRACPLTAVDLGALPDAAGDGRNAALRRADAALARVEAARPENSTLLVVGVSDTDATDGRLHVAIADGPGFDRGWLRSSSTGRMPYLQLVDIAPTVLAALDEPVPEDIAGRPVFRSTETRSESFATTRAALVDADTAAVARKHLVGTFLAGFAVLCAVVYGIAALLLRRRPAVDDPLRRRASVAITALSAFPVATFLANTVPWWRADPTTPALAAAILGAMALVTAVAVAPPWGRTATGRLAAVSAVTVVVLLADVMTGARLQLNSLLGYTALEGGRYVGFGNVAFAVLGASALLLAAGLAAGRPSRSAVAVALAVAVPVIVVEGSPGLGTDFGGILTLVPAFGVLALLVAGRKVTGRRAVAVLGAGAGLVASLAIADYLRPEEDRTHFGRFVATVLDGDGLATVDRKIRANLDLLFAGPHTIAAAILLVIAGVAVFRPPAGLRAAYRAHPGLRTGLQVVVVLGLLGFAVNDSGIAVPVNAALVALPAAVAAWLRPEPGSRFGRTTAPNEPLDDVRRENGQQTDEGDQAATEGTTDGRKTSDTPARSAGAPADVLP